MSVSIKYKGAEIASANTDVTKTLKTSGKYCEADIEVINTPDGGITPTGNINITDTNVTDVTNYATAQVVDADLVAENIKKDVNILGVVGSFEGGGGTLPSTFTRKNYVAAGGNAFETGELAYGIISYEIEFEVRAITAGNQAILGSGQGVADSLLIGTSTGKLGLAGYLNGALVIVPFSTQIDIGDIVNVSGTFNTDTGEKTATFNGETIQAIISGTNVKYHNIATVGPWYRLHKLKIWRNNQLTSNCIPCIHNSDSWGGLFDLNAMRFITIASSNPATG